MRKVWPAVTTYVRSVIWRFQVVMSFAVLNIYPVAAAVLVNGVLFGTAQGEEIIQDLSFGGSIYHSHHGLSWQHGLVMFSTLLFASTIWSTSRLLCDTPAGKTLAGFVRVRVDMPDANFVRYVGPVFLAATAAAPIMLVCIVNALAKIDPGILSVRHDPNLLLDRALDGLYIFMITSLGIFILLYHNFGQWKTGLMSAMGLHAATCAVRVWQAIAFLIGASILALILLTFPGNPEPEPLDVYTTHVNSNTHSTFDGAELETLGMLILSAVLLFVGRATINLWLTHNFSTSLSPFRRGHAIYTGILFFTCALVVWGLLVDSVRVAQGLGFIPMLMAVCTFWSILFSVGLVTTPQYLGIPSLAVLPVVLFVMFSGLNDNHQLQAVTERKSGLQLFGLPILGSQLQACLAKENKAATERLDDDLRAWIMARVQPDEITPIDVPLVIVTGSGGGIRAAEFFAQTMARLDEVTKGRFGDHIFAISTVSGASLGAAIWIKARHVAHEQLPSGSERFNIVYRIVEGFFSIDYISPIAAGLLVHDAAQQLLPFPLPGGDRSKIMEEAWDRGWRRSVEFTKDARSQREPADLGMLSQLVLAGTSAHPAPPVVVFNSTEVHTGRRFLTANRRLPSAWFPDSYLAITPCSLHGIVDMRLATAAHLSARFTVVSPAASIFGLPDDKVWEAISTSLPLNEVDTADRLVPWGQVVDGGYYENYGATTAREIAKGIQESFMRLRAAQLVPSHVRLRLLGLSMVNDPLDLSNVPLDSVRMLQQLKLGTNTKVQELRFETIWPIGQSYDLRELRSLLAIRTTQSWLTSRRRLQNELGAPLSTVLLTRESRGLTAEREFAEYLRSLNSARLPDAPVSGKWLDIRLGRMLRDANLLDYAINPGLSDSTAVPTNRKGSQAMPNPGLAWFLSRNSRDGMYRAIHFEPDDPNPLKVYGDIQQIRHVLKAICGSNSICAE